MFLANSVTFSPDISNSCFFVIIYMYMDSQGCNLYKLSQKCNLYKLLGDTFYNFHIFCLIRNNTCMLSNFQSLFSSNPIDAQ